MQNKTGVAENYTATWTKRAKNGILIRMDEGHLKTKEEIRLSRRNIIFTVLVVLFFAGIVFLYYSMLYREKRESILRDGEISAKDSADELDRYLSTNIDSVKLSAYTLDGMIREGRSDAEIQDFLVWQSTAIRSAVNENSTGLYGYINGRFFSGTNWEPPEGYVPTGRPWYIRPMENPGEITLLDPYLDIQSGNTMLAVGKTLCDGESVVSVDISLDQVQTLTEDAVKSGHSDIEMILNEQGVVVAHSDPEENGKNYQEETDTLGASIVRGLDEAAGNSFEFNFHGSHYIVYFAELSNGWHSISVNDATEVFGSLNRMLFSTIVVVIVIVLINGILMTRSNRYLHMSVSAKAANEAKSAFLSNMSHEIRTPINAILGMNEMITRESDDPTILTYAENVKNAGKSLLGLINDILDFSKIEAGKIEILSEDYDLSVMINDLINRIDTRAEEKGLEFKIAVDKDIPKCLNGDEGRLKQVITNLLTNAVKYTEKGSVTLGIGWERIDGEDAAIRLKVYVKDTGIGIREEDIPRLFSKFERIEEERNRNIEGTGLGMSITKNLLEMMGSTLEVESEYGKGSCFHFCVRQGVSKWEAIGDYEASYRDHLRKREKYREIFTAPDARILVVDDNPMNLLVFKSLVKQTGVGIDTGDGGEEGLALSCRQKYDLIFLDHMMPEKDGIETLHEIRGNAGNPNAVTPIVCLTANAISGARETYISAGFDDYLTKPIRPDRLENMMLTFLPKEKIIMRPAGEANETKEDTEGIFSALAGTMIDTEEGMKNSGSPESYLALLRIFYESVEEKAQELDRYFNEKDIKNYTIRIHALKSSARIIGAGKLGAEAQRLEDAGKAEDIGYIRTHHDAFAEEYRKLREPLSVLFAKDGPETDKPEADAAFMAAVFDEIRLAAEDMDCERLDSIFDEMKDYRVPQEQEERYHKILDASERYEYQMILSLLNGERENRGE